jgi:hypothetical protein
MSVLGLHRVVERQAVARGDQTAVIGDGGSLTYRELNQRANVVARRLMACGLRRTSRVIVRMRRSPQLAVLLLGVLKAGAAYMWVDDKDGATPWPEGVSIPQRSAHLGETLIVIDCDALLRAPSRPAPNLPIVTRPEDLACVLPRQNGLPGILLPHATITALQSHPLPELAVWSGEPAVLDLWLPLMAGLTVTVADSAVQAAEAA